MKSSLSPSDREPEYPDQVLQLIAEKVALSAPALSQEARNALRTLLTREGGEHGR
ncbi:MAG: hypothetical protein PUF11_03355 [Parafannyhessea umbonata]|uniref:hypothetical protein n=1 Tax=Parafannyhessea umbonata TaxID=604330 RepID=UPI0026F2AE52|nr:hypothetical protein [Parafannyhessea umbonata]MDD6565806.1 hypothetical protein [Parafannyhessea umbonata]